MKTNKLLLLALALVFVIAFAACNVDGIVNSNAINGLADITLTCGESLPEITPTAEFGTVTLGIAKAVEGTPKENLDYQAISSDALTEGTYYIKAYVAAAEAYKEAAAYATVTVSHQAFDAIAGDGVNKNEATADGKYRTWTEKQCACGATVIGNEQTIDKQPNAISGLADLTLKCGAQIPDLSGVTATHGDVTLEIATAVEGTDKEQLTYAAIPADLVATHGVYYVRATVAEGDDYQGATAYAKVTVNHVAFDDIEGEASHVAAEGTTKGYDYKLCTCQQQVKGDVEYVLVTVTVDGVNVCVAEVAVGMEFGVDDFIDNIAPREGYELTLLENGEMWIGTEVTDFVTIELTSYWILIDEVAFDAVTGNWRFMTSEDGYTEKTVSTLTYDKEQSVWIVNTYFDSVHPYSPAEITLSDIELKEGYSYTFVVATDKDTYINFGTETWDDNAYLVTVEDLFVIVTVIYNGDETTVWYDFETSRTYSNAQWSKHNLNGLTLAIQDKNLDNLGERYNVVISDVVAVAYDYRLHEAELVATLPEAGNIDENTADNVMAIINKINAIREAHFTKAELAKATDLSDVTEAAQTIINNHAVQLNKLLKDLPDFDTMWTANKDEQDAAFTALTKYLAYYNVKFTDEEKANYQEPKQISFYREFFKDRTVVTDDAFGQSSAPFSPWDAHSTTHWNPNGQSGYVTLPAIPYAAYDRVQFYVQVQVGTTNVLKYGDVQIDGEGWREFVITKQADGWYASLALPDAHTGAGVKLSDAVVLGNEGLQFYFANTGWGALSIGISDQDSLNHIYGTLTAGDVTVHSVKATYKNAAGADVAETKYYLDGEQLVLPEFETAYVDNYGTHTFTGWFVGETQHVAGESVTGNLELVAVYQINEGDWREYNVKYIVDDESYGDAQSYHYTDKLVLPTAPTKAEDDHYSYEFVGWFDDADKQWNDGDQVTSNLELVAKFNSVDKTRTKYIVTLTNLEGDNQTVEVYENDAATLPKVAREGFTFDCWQLNGAKYDENALVKGQITLVAKWLVKASGEKGTVITVSYLSENVTGSLNDGRTAAFDNTDSWWTDNDGTKLDQWFLVGNNKTKALLDFELPLINFNNYSYLTFNLLINANFTGSISIIPDGSENPTDLASNSRGGCVKMVLAKVNGVWTIAAHCEDGSVQSAAIPANVVAGEAKLTLRYWTNADWTANDDGVSDGPWVFMSEIKGIEVGNVDYVAKAAEAATAIDNLADDADDATKLAALKTYMYWRLCFTAYEQENNAETTSVVALKTYLNGLGAQNIVENCYNEIETTLPDWNDDNNNPNHVKYNPNGNSYSVSLPKIMYGMYDSITMVMKCNSEAATFTASYGNESIDVTMNASAGWLMLTVNKHDDGCYYMKVWDANGSASFEIKLSNEIVRGDQAFTFNLATTAWAWCWLGTTSADNCITATVAK